jgi:hypothetical protein
MIVNENAEAKLVEKLREMMDKPSFRAGEEMSRTFTVPSMMDSDDRIHISITVRADSLVPISDSGPTKY